MTARYIVGETREVVASLPDGSVDLVLTSPPFLALRSYLPADHEEKHREIGSEASPADFLDVLLDLVEEWGRVLAPHGSIAVELGDTFASSGGAGGDYTNEDGWRAGQNVFDGSARRSRGAAGWPQAKSLCLIPQLFAGSLAYGRNLLRPERLTPSWKVRNWITWARPNPPVGALGDKVRPASSFFTVATKSATRWFDLDAVRTPYGDLTLQKHGGKVTQAGAKATKTTGMAENFLTHAGAPPLDWWSDPEDDYATMLVEQSTEPFKGAHYATWPRAVAKRMVDMQCPLRVCRVCGEPSRRIVGAPEYVAARQPFTDETVPGRSFRSAHEMNTMSGTKAPAWKQEETVGWSDCGHDDWRAGMTLDPFAGSGTTLAVASGSGRDSIGIDIDARNADLALERVGPLMLTVVRFGSEEVA